MADKRIYGELSEGEVKGRAAGCGVDSGDALRNQVGHQTLPPAQEACLKRGMADDPAAKTSTFDKIKGVMTDAFSAVSSAAKEVDTAIKGAAVDALGVGVGAVQKVGEPIVTHGAKQAESAARYGEPAGPKR